MSKILTAEDILNETSSDEESSSSDSPKAKPKPEASEQPEVDEKFGNITTSKSAEMNDSKRLRAHTNTKLLNEPVNPFFIEQSNESSSDAEEHFNKTRRQSYRANQSESVTYKTFAADPSQSSPNKQCDSPLGKVSRLMDEVEQSQIDDAKLLRMIEQESDSDSVASGEQKKVKSNGSILSEEDLLNRSLESEGDEAIDPNNFLRYASEKVNQKQDMLEIIDKNERSFKHVAEKMVQQSSQLIGDEAPIAQRRLTHQKLLRRITWDQEPTCISCLEDYIALGFADGSVRLFDSAETELKVLTDKSTKGSAVTCIDMKRVDKSQNVFVLCGHSKSQLSLFEIKGLVCEKTSDQRTEVEAKHRKTIEENHKTSIVSAKFVGDLQREILVMSSDIAGVICTTSLVDSFVMFRANQFVFAKTRLGPAFSIAPMLSLAPVQQKMEFTISGIKEQGVQAQLQKKLKEVTLDKIAEAEDAIRPQIVAFGSLDEVYVSQIKPTALALLSIKRPPYVRLGTVPYLDWGYALTPTFRDQAYPCVAIAWGQAIQLAVYSNKKRADTGEEAPMLCLDGFYVCEQSIDSVFFLSESLLLVVVNSKDVRILYSQNFTPGVYDEDLSSKLVNSRKQASAALTEKETIQVKMFEEAKLKYGPVSAYAEKDSGYKITEDELRSSNFEGHYQMTSEVGPRSNHNQTVCKNFGFTVTALGAIVSQRNLIHWEEYLDLIRRTSPDFLKVLKAALDIFNGKMIGLAGLPDQKEQREQLMREKMKDLLRQNINACIREFKEGQAVSDKTLRVATEFCIRIGAVDHVFGELFEMFRDNGVEAMYFNNLDAFVLSGKLKQVRIPAKVLDRVINFYRQKDVQLLEQALLNLNLTKYPGAEDVRFMCEEEFLSSALIHLLTTIFHEEKESDSTTCLSILCSLFNIMMRAKLRSSQQEVQGLLQHLERFSTSVFELSPQDALLIRESGDKQQIFQEQRKWKIDVEHSSTYIGYKILWIITLFLEGKKFPAGNLSELRWRYYVMDIVRFFTNERFLQWFLDFDPDSFFTVLKKLFTDPEPRGFIDTQDDFLAKNREANPFLEQCYTHEDIVQILVRKVRSVIQADRTANEGRLTLKSEKLQNAFLFFLTQICRTGKVKVSKALCVQVVKDQIAFHKTLRRLPKKDLLDFGSDIYSCLIRKNEKDVIQVLVQGCPQLSPEEGKQLLDLCQSSPMFKLKVYLYQLTGDLQKCLNLFFQIKAIKSDVFSWLQEIEHTLQYTDGGQQDGQQVEDNFFAVRGVGSRITLNRMKELITKNLVDFATMDPAKTALLCQQWFDSDYMFVADELRDHREACYQFLSAVLLRCQDRILLEYNNQQLVSERHNRVLLRLLEILGERKIKNYSKQAVELVSHNYFPIDEGIKVCSKRSLTEAHAVLLRRKGLYQESVALYMQAIVSLCVEKLMHTIFVEKNIKFEDPLCTNEHMTQFDYLISQVVRICAKYGDRQTREQMEALWMFAIKTLFEVRTEVFKRKRDAEEASDSDSSADRERHEEEMQFEKFVLIRNQHFLSKMSEHVNLKSVIQFLELCGHAMKYDDFRRTFEDKIQNELYFINILNAAIKLGTKEVGVHSAELATSYSKGFKTRTKCDGCRMNLVNKFDRQEIWVMSCQHSFHARCIAKTEGQCSVCFNELDVIQSFQQLRQKTKGKSDVDDLLQKREESLKRSIGLANQGSQKKRLESREDRFKRCMAEHDAYEGRRDLHRADFLLV